MGSLVKVVGDQLVVANYRVAGPGYILYVSEGRSAYGWNYIADTVTEEDYVAYWTEDTIYQKGDQVSYLGSIWESTLDDNVWTPGVCGWFDTVAANTWIQPTGAHDAYKQGTIISHLGKLWVSLVDANVWAPAVSGWREYLAGAPTDAAPAAWIQPTGAHDAYQTNDQVTHNEQIWTSTIDANVWEPGVYGWVTD